MALVEVVIGHYDGTYPELPAAAWQDGRVSRSHEAPQPMNVLFVCTANICRSPSMELLARNALREGSGVSFASAGIHGLTDRPIDEVVAAALPKEVDTSSFRSRPLTRGLLVGADLVVTAEAAHRRFILDDQPLLFRKVVTLGQATGVVRRAGPGLTRDDLPVSIASARGQAHPADDVLDPYGQGLEAATAMVRRVQGLLNEMLPVLERE